MRGITGPLEVFEGNKGFMEAIAGPFEIDWATRGPGAGHPHRSSRSTTPRSTRSRPSKAILELQQEHGIRAERRRARSRSRSSTWPTTSSAAARKATRRSSHTKEEADHSLPYMVAVALLDGQVMPEQYRPERIAPPGRPGAAAAGCASGPRGAQPALSRRDALPADGHAARRPRAQHGEDRLRRLPHAADALGHGVCRSSSASAGPYAERGPARRSSDAVARPGGDPQVTRPDASLLRERGAARTE